MTIKRIIISLLVIVPFIAMSCDSGEISSNKSAKKQDSGTFTNVSVTDLNSAMSEGGEFTILDVRTPGEVASGFIEGTKKIDVNNANFKTEVEKLDKSETVYVYCRSGHRSQKACKVLISLGFTDVINVEGGFVAWSQKGYKVAK